VTFLVIEQALNGFEFGLMLFLIAAGLTLVFGIMDLINLAHGALYMLGAYFAAALTTTLGSFWMALPLALVATALVGVALEILLFRRLYRRDHLSQVLATFALILLANETVAMIWGRSPVALSVPPALSGAADLGGGFLYPAYRLAIIGAGLAVAALLYGLIAHTRIGMQVRAGASNRDMARALGVDIGRLFTLLFGLGAALCGLAGALLGPLLSVQPGMGENVLILAFVVIVIGGIGSVRGAFVGALLVGIIDTCGRALLPLLLRQMFDREIASSLGPALASILIYVLMAAILIVRPQGLFARG
jgi:branched-chain amino acid transport system permease protein